MLYFPKGCNKNDIEGQDRRREYGKNQKRNIKYAYSYTSQHYTALSSIQIILELKIFSVNYIK